VESTPRQAGPQDAILQQARYHPGMAIAVERLHRITTDVAIDVALVLGRL
jgi:hypothetical protein